MMNEQARSPQKIMVIGANGGIGRKAVEEALAAGHYVTALLRDPAKLDLSHPRLRIIQGDVLRPETYEMQLQHIDYIISAIGGQMNKPTTLYSEGSRCLIATMKKMAVSRAFFISASAIEISPLLPFYVKFAAKYILQKLLRHGYADQRIMEHIIKESDINWTIMRPPRLTNKPVTGHYRFAVNSFLKNCLSISRADVAHFMINNANNKATWKAVVELGY